MIDPDCGEYLSEDFAFRRRWTDLGGEIWMDSVDVRWQVERDDRASQRMSMEWTEHGGPAVTPPTRRGFGSDLIERGLARQFGGSAALDFGSNGLRCRISAPLPNPAP